jgi:hypothetical protein
MVEANICNPSGMSQDLFSMRPSENLENDFANTQFPGFPLDHWFACKAEKLRDLKVGGQVGCQVGGQLSVQTNSITS